MMTRLEDFEARIAQTVSRSDEARVVEMREQDAEMVERIRVQTASECLADRLHRDEIRPRMEVVARRFDDAHLEHVKTLVGTFSICTLSRSERFPASTTLTIGVSFESSSQSTAATYNLQIIPVFMEYEAHDDLPIHVEEPDVDAIVAWIEHKLQTFVDTYLRVEYDPRYRKAGRHTDSVCGMVVEAGNVSHRSEYARRNFSFCSAACKQKFDQHPAFYADGDAVSIPQAV